MNEIFTKDLKPGQVFSSPVYSEGSYLLVAANVPLRQKDINVLITCKIKSVRTDGILIDPESEPAPLEEVDDITKLLDARIAEAMAEIEEIDKIEDAEPIPDDPITETKAEYEVPSNKGTIKFSISDVRHNSSPYRAYKNLIEKLNKLFANLKSGVDVEMRMIDNISVQLIQDVRDSTDSFIGFILGGEVTGNELAKSSVNTAILSALMAQEFRLPNHKINNIVSGALLHDIGMLRLSKGITEKKGGLSEAELEQIKSHPLHTSKIVTKELFGPHEVNLIALQHHERWDGQGYPDKLVGQAIDIGARIVSVADAFEAMVSKKSYRNSMVGYQAIKNLLADNARRFDPSVIIAFTKIMGIYPIGSIVRLNDSSIARVTRIHTTAPLRPVVQMLADKGGNALGAGEMKTVDLLAEKKLFIKGAIDPAEYSEKNA
ncbi:MAG: HD-GYP domain-containing protein [Treponema sp.]|nr:HD-GYP domain-containing protein [Treponema sp.]